MMAIIFHTERISSEGDCAIFLCKGVFLFLLFFYEVHPISLNFASNEQIYI